MQYFQSFPIFQSIQRKKTIDNCIDAVNRHADVFILIIGGRYGNILDSGKSIINTEFIAAKRKGIPIYIFIKKNILNILSVWQKNKLGDYSDFVDTNKIFDFISEIRNDSKLWTFEFDSAQDIYTIIGTQLSYLFKDCLKLRTKFNSELDEYFQNNLSIDAQRILIEKGDFYEFDFFSQTLIDELSKKKDIKNDYEYRIILDSNTSIEDVNELLSWIGKRTNIVSKIMDSLNSLISTALNKYLAAPGVPSDLKGLFYVSKTYARIYERLITWTIDTAGAKVDDEYVVLRDKLANLSRKAVSQVWDYQYLLAESIKITKIKYLSGDENLLISASITLEIDENDMNEYNNEFMKLKSKMLPYT